MFVVPVARGDQGKEENSRRGEKASTSTKSWRIGLGIEMQLRVGVVKVIREYERVATGGC